MDLGELSWTCMIEYFFFILLLLFPKTISRYSENKETLSLLDDSFLYYLGRFIGFGIGQWVYQSAPRVDSSGLEFLDFVCLFIYVRPQNVRAPTCHDNDNDNLSPIA